MVEKCSIKLIELFEGGAIKFPIKTKQSTPNQSTLFSHNFVDSDKIDEYEDLLKQYFFPIIKQAERIIASYKFQVQKLI